ncbi:MAG: hypothetical protein K6T65_11270 [Peptococcaceae bacterium]|nr:hypothetical protein [Peptococcaceae bacterium]
MRDIMVNLWYSYLSRRLWETPKGNYGISPHYKYNFALFSYIMAFICIELINYYMFTIKGYLFEELINKGVFFFVKETWFILISFLLIIYYFLILDEFILTGTTVKRWFVERYAKMRIKKETIKKQSENKCCYSNDSEIPYLSGGESVANYSFGNVRRRCLEKTKQKICKLLTIAFVADRKNIYNSPRDIKKRECEQKQHTAVIAGDNSEKQEKKSENKIKDYSAGVYQEFREIVNRTKPTTLETAPTPDRKSLGDGNSGKENSESNEKSFICVSNDYFCRRPVKQNEEKNMTQLMDKQGDDIGNKCKKDNAYSKYRIIQSKDLLSEYNKKEKILLCVTSTVWVPLALIDGGLRPARLLVEAPYNKWIGFVDSICLYIILCMHGLFFIWLINFLFQRGLQF